MDAWAEKDRASLGVPLICRPYWSGVAAVTVVVTPLLVVVTAGAPGIRLSAKRVFSPAAWSWLFR